MLNRGDYRKQAVHCRTGSLEKTPFMLLPAVLVHCRTGSLEKNSESSTAVAAVHCRTGSLEIPDQF